MKIINQNATTTDRIINIPANQTFAFRDACYDAGVHYTFMGRRPSSHTYRLKGEISAVREIITRFTRS